MHEAQMHPVSSFVTLTYEGAVSPSLDYSAFQRFMYRVRRRLGPTRFFMCGEYGEVGQRPHFHALLFGRSFSDGVPCGKNIQSSRVLSELWPHGFSSFGDVTYDSASYVARYASKKITGALAEVHYSRVDFRTGEVVQCVPEFGHMSLKPGIGATWFEKYWRDVYIARDGVVRRGGQVVPPPRFYDKLLSRLAETDDVARHRELEIEFARLENAESFRGETTRSRLAVREQCALAKARFLRRTL